MDAELLTNQIKRVIYDEGCSYNALLILEKCLRYIESQNGTNWRGTYSERTDKER